MRLDLKQKNKCDFCVYWTGRSCMVTPSSYNCKKANDEYYQYLKKETNTSVKSLRRWDNR